MLLEAPYRYELRRRVGVHSAHHSAPYISIAWSTVRRVVRDKDEAIAGRQRREVCRHREATVDACDGRWSLRPVLDAPRAQHALCALGGAIGVASHGDAAEASLDEGRLVEPRGRDDAVLRVRVLESPPLNVIPFGSTAVRMHAVRHRARHGHPSGRDPCRGQLSSLELMHAQGGARSARCEQRAARAYVHDGQRTAVP